MERRAALDARLSEAKEGTLTLRVIPSQETGNIHT